jgi:protein-S-isoprenylcysteine O-methyltransferase Ste14
VVAPLLLLFLTWVATVEERYLSTRFGEEYHAYRTQVRRWF